MTPIILFLISLAVIFNTVAQLALKTGMQQIGAFSFSWTNLSPVILKAMVSPWIMLGMFTYIGSVGVWLMVLSRTPVSIAYPMSSLGYITSAVAACYLLGENLSVMRMTGIFIILIGVYMVAKS